MRGPPSTEPSKFSGQLPTIGPRKSPGMWPHCRGLPRAKKYLPQMNAEENRLELERASCFRSGIRKNSEARLSEFLRIPLHTSETRLNHLLPRRCLSAFISG